MTKALTGIAYDPIFLTHDQPGHPENSKRLDSVVAGLKSSGLWEKISLLKSRRASFDEIKLCHSEDYINYVKKFCESGSGYLDPDTYANKYSFTAAATAVGGVIDLTKAVIKGELRNGFALVRPPGHHALRNRSMGFCLFGNIAIAAKAALSQSGINKAAIVDFDVHHGNGTQSLVEDDPNIFYISTHQYPFYPGTGSIREIGKGKAEGTLLNVPLPPDAGDTGFRKIYEELIIPALERFKPDIILISAGYDAHWDDPLANLRLSLSGYSYISKSLIETAERTCNSKIVFTLEGGYNLSALSAGVANSVRSLLRLNDFDDPLGNSPHDEPDITGLIKELKSIHQL